MTAKSTPAGALAVGLTAAAAISGLTVTRLRAEINAGRLRSFKVGRRRLVRVSALNAYLEQCEQIDNARPAARQPRPRQSAAPLPFPHYARAR